MDRPNTILSAGRLYCDVIFTGLPRMPTPGTEVFCGGVGFHTGGGAPITAGHLAALGHHVALASILPASPIGELILADLNTPGVNLSLCRPASDSQDPQITVALAHNGERAFVTHRTGPAIPGLSAERVSALGVTHLHIGELKTLIENPELLALAKALQATTSLDCSWDDDLTLTDVAPLLPEVDVFLPNEAEAAMLGDLGVSPPFNKLTVIKQGADGATALTGGRTYHSAAAPADVVDTTGAGDAFNAGFLSAWLDGQPIETCLRAGNDLGAKAVTYRGGISPCGTG